MRATGFLWLTVAALSAGIAAAEAPTRSLVPKGRPSAEVQLPVMIKPKPRPNSFATAQPQPPAISAKVSVCGNPRLKGVALKPIKSRIKGCNVPAPVSLTEVNGVRLVPAATINCEAAQALSTWVERGLQPQFEGQVVRLMIADSTSCRPRNNVRGAKVSEHGSGNAIDIAGVVLRTGKLRTVTSSFRGALQAAHRAACGPFRTTLGPGSDGYHEDHMHFDVAKNRGLYCR